MSDVVQLRGGDKPLWATELPLQNTKTCVGVFDGYMAAKMLDRRFALAIFYGPDRGQDARRFAGAGLLGQACLRLREARKTDRRLWGSAKRSTPDAQSEAEDAIDEALEIIYPPKAPSLREACEQARDLCHALIAEGETTNQITALGKMLDAALEADDGE